MESAPSPVICFNLCGFRLSDLCHFRNMVVIGASGDFGYFLSRWQISSTWVMLCNQGHPTILVAGDVSVHICCCVQTMVVGKMHRWAGLLSSGQEEQEWAITIQ